ncbi:MAG: substrate-binding domain-containing protein [Pseudomonadota bacterium]
MNLRELSDLLGLSPTTVSRALGGYPEVSAETRRRVRAAAAEHDYRPNRRAAALATGRAMAIGHVIPTDRGNEMVNPIFADFIAGAGEVYAQGGYDMTMSVVSDGDEATAYRQLALDRGVDGMIVHGPRQDDTRLAVLRETGTPFVVHGRVPGCGLDYDFVDVDNVRAFRRATDVLLDLGHRRIGLLNGPAHMDFACRRREGFLAALDARGIAIAPARLHHSEMSERAGYEAVAADLASDTPSTAFVVASLIMALGARRALQDAGLAIGRDVSLVTHDDMLSYLSNDGEVPLFTATRSSVRAAGRRCAEILLARILAPETPPVQEIWESELVLGGSTGPVADPPSRPRNGG